MARQIVVEVVGDARKFNAATTGAVAKAETLTGKLRNVGKGMVIGAGIRAFDLLNDALSFGISQIGVMDVKFKEFQASQTRLTVALKNNIPAWNGNTKAAFAYAEAQKRLGFNAIEVQDSIGQLIGQTHDLAKAQELVGLAEDLARSKGIDLATATDVVTKAYNGNAKGLKSLGIDVAGATTGTELLAAAYRNVTTTAEEYAKTSEGKTAVANAKIEAAMVKIGAVIDKVAVVVLPMLADAFVSVADVIDKASPAMAFAVQAAQRIIVPAIQAIIAVIKALIAVTQAAVGAVNTLLGKNDQLRKQEEQRKSSGGFFSNLPFFGGPRASGGPVDAGGLYVVGERGPELLQMGNRSGEIIPNSPMGGGGGVYVFHFNGPVYGDGPFLDELSNRIAQRLRYATGR